MRAVTRTALATFLLPALLVGCGDESFEPLAPEAPALGSANASVTGSNLVECPVDETRSVTRTLGLLGGTVTLGGHSIALPFGAVILPTPITLAVPASNYMEVEITANHAESFEFEQPVTITISYDRCTRRNIDRSALTVWQIDPDTKALIEPMGGEDDKTARTVTFGSGHLSGFAIAN